MWRLFGFVASLHNLQAPFTGPIRGKYRIMTDGKYFFSFFFSSPKWIRGAIVSGYQWAITIGLLLAAVVNDATKHRDDHSSYQIPIAVQFIWSFILVTGMLFLPEVRRSLFVRTVVHY